jgi:hypothetical protein
VRIGLDETAVKAVLEDVTDEVVAPVETLRIAEVEVMHPLRDVRLRGLQDQVVVVVQQAIRMASPVASSYRPFEKSQEPRAVDVVGDDLELAVPARRDVVDPAGNLRTGWTWHTPQAR